MAQGISAALWKMLETDPLWLLLHEIPYQKLCGVRSFHMIRQSCGKITYMLQPLCDATTTEAVSEELPCDVETVF